MTRKIQDGSFGWYEKGAMQKIETLPFRQQATCKLIYIALCSLSARKKNNPVIDCYRFDIMRYASIDDRTVRRRLPLLEKLGIIRIEPQDRLSDGKYKKARIWLVQNVPAVGHLVDRSWTDRGQMVVSKSDTIKKERNKKEEINIDSKESIVKQVSQEEKKYGNEKINQMLEFLQQAVDVTDFKESRQQQRQCGNNLVRLMEKLTRQVFAARLETILSNDFHRKNCGSLDYIYRQVKGFVSEESGISKIQKDAVGFAIR